MSVEENVPSEQKPRFSPETLKHFARQNKEIRRKEILTAAPKVALWILSAVALVVAVIFVMMQLLASRETVTSAAQLPTYALVIMAAGEAVIAVVSFVVVIAAPLFAFKGMREAVDNLVWIITWSILVFVGCLAAAVLINALYLGIVFYR